MGSSQILVRVIRLKSQWGDPATTQYSSSVAVHSGVLSIDRIGGSLPPSCDRARPRERPVPRRGRSAACLLCACVIAVFAFAAYHQITERIVMGGVEDVEARHARLHDLGGFWLIVIQLPMSAAVVGLVYRFLRRAAPERLLRRLWAAPPRAWLLVAVCVSGLANAVWFGAVLDGGATVEDDHAYLFQASLIAQGRIAIESPWEGFGQAFVWPWMIGDPGRIASFQMPGHCFFLAIGVLLNCPWSIPVLTGMVMIAAACVAARRMFGRQTAILTALLLMASPYVLTTNGSYSASASVAMCVALVLLAASPVLCGRPSVKGAVVLGASLGLLWFVRPPTAIFCGIPIALAMVRARRDRRRWRTCLLVTGVVATLGTAPYFAYCRAATGRWSMSPGSVYGQRLTSDELSPRNIFSTDGHQFGFRIPNTVTSLVRLNCYLFGWPISLAPLAALLWLRDWRGPTGCLLATCALLIGFYCLSEKTLGWYYYEIVPCLAILGARGIVGMHRVAPLRARPGPMSRDKLPALVLAFSAAAVSITLPLTMLRHSQFTREWMAAHNWVTGEIPTRNALVLYDPAHVDRPTAIALSGMNDPQLSNRVVFARAENDPALEDALRARFPGRIVYRYSRDTISGAHRLEPVAEPDGSSTPEGRNEIRPGLVGSEGP